MKDNQLKKVAQKAGASLSSVKKTLAHCEGPGTDLRNRIFSAADENGVASNDGRSVDAYVILPSVPAFFWRNIMDTLGAELRTFGVCAKYNFYSHLGDREIVERYLREARSMNAKVILVAAKYEELDEHLTEIANDCAVFSLVEPICVPNTFFIGSDLVADGRLLATKCIEEHPDAKNILLIGSAPDRQKGFTEAAVGVNVLNITESKEEDAAMMARKLDRIYREEPFDIVVCMGGFATKICLAMKKCRLDIPCYSFEHQHIDDRYAPPIGEICQDTMNIAREAAKATNMYLRYAKYPDSKYTYIPSAYYAQGIKD